MMKWLLKSMLLVLRYLSMESTSSFIEIHKRNSLKKVILNTKTGKASKRLAAKQHVEKTLDLGDKIEK